MKKLNIRSFSAFISLSIVATPLIWKGSTMLLRGIKNEAVTEDWKIGLSSDFALANKLPDGAYFFPARLYLNRPSNEVRFEDIKSLIGVSSENSITVLNEPTAQIHYLVQKNNILYHAAVSPTYSVEGFDLDRQKAVFKDDSTITCTYRVSDTVNNKRMGMGLIIFLLGLCLSAFGFYIISSRVEKILSVVPDKKN